MKLRFRTGVNTGPVLMGEGENLAIGDAVNVAARLEQVALPGEIVLGEETLRLVRDAVEVEALEPLDLKGKSERVSAYRLISVDPSAAGFARHMDVPLVGRVGELALLHQAWSRTVRDSRCHLLTLLGEAGVGKSRLVSEFLSGIGEQATVLRGRCLHYGEGITFWPLAEALMPVGEPAARVLEHLSTGGLAAPEELFWDVRRLLETLAADRPVVLYLDDLQWAEPMLLDLLDHVAELSRGAPILLLCTARPELLDARPGWGGGKLTATTTLLEPLVVKEAEALLEELGDGLDQETRVRVIKASEGNPLFLEEMVALARERGTVEVPSTIQALLASRLERLGVEEREVLERGAVEGEVFHRLGIKALAGERLAAEVELRLTGLVRKELIRPHPATLSGDAFRFRHLLIRDAAYDGLPKVTRAELHERFARWLEESAADLLELDEITGWHLERAVRYRQELGLEIDPRLTRGAVEHLHKAGLRAGVRIDVAAAANLLERALALAPEDDPRHAQIAVELAEQLVEAGDFARLDELLSQAERDPISGTLALLTKMEALINMRPEEAVGLIDSGLPELLERLTRLGDPRALAKAQMVAFHRDWLSGHTVSASEHARMAAIHAAEAGDVVLRSRALHWYMGTLVMGQAHARLVAEFLHECEHEDPGPYLAAFLDIGRGNLCRLEGDLDGALGLLERGIETQRGLGLRLPAASQAMSVAKVHMSAGDPAAAADALKRGDAVLAEHGERAWRSTVQAGLARAHAELHDREAALAACDLSDELSAAEDLANYAITHGVRARVALEEGDSEQAQQWANSAVEYAFQTDFPEVQAEAKLELAGVLSALGRRDQALTAAREALAIQEAKGDRPGMAEAQALLDRL